MENNLILITCIILMLLAVFVGQRIFPVGKLSFKRIA